LHLVRDLSDDGVLDVVLRAWSGGAHGGFAYYVYSAGQRPRCLLSYYKKYADDDPHNWPGFQPRDLNGAGRKEVISWYDGFAYWNEVWDWSASYGGSARVPIVLGFQSGRLVDVTSEYRPWLRRKAAQAKERLLDELHESGGQRLTGDRSQGMIQYYAIARLLYDRSTAQRLVLRLIPKAERSFFLKHCGLIERVLAKRWQRSAYPPAYSRSQPFASEVLPQPDTVNTARPDTRATDRERRGG
jgi:hypothetical protein